MSDGGSSVTTRATIAGVERHALPRGPNTVACDFPGCENQTYVQRGQDWSDATKAAARAEAAGKGWTFRDGIDLCPTHSGPISLG
jgi:hypothetical protein